MRLVFDERIENPPGPNGPVSCILQRGREVALGVNRPWPFSENAFRRTLRYRARDAQLLY